MRVLHINAGEVWSGIEQRILFIARYLKEKRVYCALAISPFSPLWKKAEKEGIKVFPLKIKSEFSLPSIFKLRKIIREEGITLLHTHRSSDHWLGFWASRGLEIMLIRTRHNLTPIPKNPFNYFLYQKATHHFIAVAEIIKRAMIEDFKIPPSKITTIHSAVDIEKFKRKKGGLREELGFPSNIPLVGTVGRIRDHKDYPLFLETARWILERNPKVRFVIVGEGPLEGYIRKLTRDFQLDKKVIFLGKREDVEKIVPDFDVFLLTSKIEGSPAVIKEAMLCGIPVVASKVGGIPEIIENGKEGVLISRRNPEDFGRAVLELLDQKEKVKKMVEKARKKVRENYSPEILGKETLEVYERLHQR